MSTLLPIFLLGCSTFSDIFSSFCLVLSLLVSFYINFYPGRGILNNQFLYSFCLFVCFMIKKSFFHLEGAQDLGRLVDPTGRSSWNHSCGHPLLIHLSSQIPTRIYHIHRGHPFTPLPHWFLPLPWFMNQTFQQFLFLSRPQQPMEPR